MSWGRTSHADGRVTATTTEALSPSDVARTVDPAAPWVLLSRFGPGLRGWTRVRVPLTDRRLLHPVPATVRALGFEVLLTTAEFLDLAPELEGPPLGPGLFAHQLRVRPTDHVTFTSTPVPAGRLRAFGLVVEVDLPHADENALLTTVSDAEMDAALGRLEGS